MDCCACRSQMHGQRCLPRGGRGHAKAPPSDRHNRRTCAAARAGAHAGRSPLPTGSGPPSCQQERRPGGTSHSAFSDSVHTRGSACLPEQKGRRAGCWHLLARRTKAPALLHLCRSLPKLWARDVAAATRVAQVVPAAARKQGGTHHPGQMSRLCSLTGRGRCADALARSDAKSPAAAHPCSAIDVAGPAPSSASPPHSKP